MHANPLLNLQLIPEGQMFYVTKDVIRGPAIMDGFHYNNNHYEFIFLRQGTCYCYINDDFYLVGPGCVALMNKGSCHYHNYNPAEVRVLYHIMFNDDYLDYYQRCTGQQLLKALLPDRAIQLDDDTAMELATMLDVMIKDNPVDPLEKAMLCQRLNLFWLRFTLGQRKLCRTEKNTTMHPTLVQILAYLQEHYHEHITLDHLVERYSLNKSYLCRLFSKELNLSFTNYLNQLRLTAANNLLADSVYSLDEIAIRTGFSNANYFCRVYKQAFGVTPRRRSTQGCR